MWYNIKWFYEESKWKSTHLKCFCFGQAGLELLVILLPQLSGAGIIGVNHHGWLDIKSCIFHVSSPQRMLVFVTQEVTWTVLYTDMALFQMDT